MGTHDHSYIWEARSIRAPLSHSVTGTVLFAAHILLLPAAIGSTTTVLALLALTIICVIVVRRRVISRAAARVGAAKAPPEASRPKTAL